jgi:hypothetical protein
MGNCTGVCNGCNEQDTKFDVNQIRNSIKDNDNMSNERFGNLPQKDHTYGGNGGDYSND